jgi:hypothetical protein
MNKKLQTKTFSLLILYSSHHPQSNSGNEIECGILGPLKVNRILSTCYWKRSELRFNCSVIFPG